MSKIKLFIFSGLFVCFLIPQTSDAYYTTKQQAIRFNDTTALFVIDYTFSLPESQGAMLPALAVRNQSELNNALIYEVLLDGKTVTNDGTATGVKNNKNSSIQ
ncbi:hypothetical protein KC723_00995, partial [Candidatus Kaiserbacteria bacterium]|nr:hypothetical protein [Candidatus Kaiserbacteria bacterium]